MGKFIFRKKNKNNKPGKNLPKRNGQAQADLSGQQENILISTKGYDAHIAATAASKRFAFLKNRVKPDTTITDKTKTAPSSEGSNEFVCGATYEEGTTQKSPSISPGCDAEHLLQDKWESKDRAINFYNKQVLDFLAPKMQEFIKRQEFLFIASADRNGECDCTSKFGNPGFIRVLSEKYLMYPEYRGNGVFANTGNMIENPHIALLMIDFTQDTVGLHVNGKVRVVVNEELLEYGDKLPDDVIEEIHQEGKKCPERWMMIEVEEAYIQCSKHIPLMKKLDKKIDWGTDNVAAKGGDYFQLMNIPLYERIGGDKAMEVCTDIFYRKVLQDELVGRFFEDVDMERQRLKQKSFLTMAFGGPYKYTNIDLREGHKHLHEKFGLSDQHFDRVCEIFRETVTEINIPPDQIEEMMSILESTRDAILNR
jgi:truncated hemoglobin YjbI/predicted pyridoxine 5'-phosphate oxidase superfamily flavin-nucleotide-binding protein